MLVKFSCGCIGLVLDEGNPFVLVPCDADEVGICVWRRDLSDKAHEPLDTKRAVELIEEIGGLVADGYRFRQVRSLLGR